MNYLIQLKNFKKKNHRNKYQRLNTEKNSYNLAIQMSLDVLILSLQHLWRYDCSESNMF